MELELAVGLDTETWQAQTFLGGKGTPNTCINLDKAMFCKLLGDKSCCIFFCSFLHFISHKVVLLKVNKTELQFLWSENINNRIKCFMEASVSCYLVFISLNNCLYHSVIYLFSNFIVLLHSFKTFSKFINIICSYNTLIKLFSFCGGTPVWYSEVTPG